MDRIYELSDKDQELKEEIKDATTQIPELKNHHIWSDIQRSKIVEDLDDKTVLLTIDWAMKFLPMHHREVQQNFFGKRGISWHISHALGKINGKIIQHLLIYIIEGETQYTYLVNAILKQVFHELF